MRLPRGQTRQENAATHVFLGAHIDTHIYIHIYIYIGRTLSFRSVGLAKIMVRIAYLSMDNRGELDCHDSLTFAHLQILGHRVEEVPWRSDSKEDESSTSGPNSDNRWSRYDYVILRSCWDYQSDPASFLRVLETIEASTATLLNPLSIVRWNIDKAYLRDLESRGAAIVPTMWSDHLTATHIEEAFAKWKTTSELIIKPAISASAFDTFRVSPDGVGRFMNDHGHIFANRSCLLQPFLTAIVTEGEFSLFYFAGQFSHCILKTPKDQDFRVQEEYGGINRFVPRPEAALLEAGARVLSCIGEPLLYARLDFVRSPDSRDAFGLMEAELIEPSLYFNLDPSSAQRFAKALHEWIAADSRHASEELGQKPVLLSSVGVMIINSFTKGP